MAKLTSALRNRDVRLLMGAFATTQLGDWLYNVVLLAYVFDRTGSATWVGVTSVVRILPIIVFGAFGGVVADRFPRIRVMIVSDVVRAGLMLAIAILAGVDAPVWLIVALVAVSTTVGTPHLPATTALLPELVDDADLAAANSLVNAIFYAAVALGPAIGGLIAIVGSASLVFAINGATFLISAGITHLIGRPVRAEPAPGPTAWAQVRAGVGAILGSADVALLASLIPAASFIPGCAFVLLVLVSSRFLETGPQGANFLFAAIGIGAAAAAAGASRLADARRPGRVFALGLGLTAAPYAGLAFVRAPAPAYALLAVSGAATMVMEAVFITVLQRLLPADVLGRVFGLMDALIYGGILAGSLVSTLLVQVFGLQAALLTVSGSVVVIAALSFGRLSALSGGSEEPIADPETAEHA